MANRTPETVKYSNNADLVLELASADLVKVTTTDAQGRTVDHFVDADELAAFALAAATERRRRRLGSLAWPTTDAIREFKRVAFNDGYTPAEFMVDTGSESFSEAMATYAAVLIVHVAELSGAELPANRHPSASTTHLGGWWGPTLYERDALRPATPASEARELLREIDVAADTELLVRR